MQNSATTKKWKTTSFSLEKVTRLASEKSLCMFMFPTPATRRRKAQLPLQTNFGRIGFHLEKAKFDYENWIIMDIIATAIMHTNYTCFAWKIDYCRFLPTQKDKRVKEAASQLSKNTLQSLIKRMKNGEKIETIFEKPFTTENNEVVCIQKPPSVVIDDDDLRRDIPFLRKYSSNQLRDLFLQTSECLLTMNFCVQYYDEDKKKYDTIGNSNKPNLCNLYSVKIDEERKTADGKVRSRVYIIDSNSWLSFFFYRNCLSGFVNILPYRFYTLSPEAQLFFRILVLNNQTGRTVLVDLRDITNRFVFRPGDPEVKHIVRKVLQELADEKFIEDPKEIYTPKKGLIFSFEKRDFLEELQDIRKIQEEDQGEYAHEEEFEMKSEFKIE